ncbi:energy transducer TonB [Lysobacter sp. FW306-1B-D06B]|uniref:energy transducer TonB n=1 Tax=Lysobacter sp. FW306-1B-D06B TaxID=3140250 RepID=UPI00314019B0
MAASLFLIRGWQRWAFCMLLAWPGCVLACEKQSQPSVDDVVFNRVTPETSRLDMELQERYGCKYPFAMIFSSAGYQPMSLLAGAQPATPNDESGSPVTGTVLIGFVLNADGTPIDPLVLKSDDDRLSKLAMDHVTTLRYRPAQFNSRTVRSLGIQVYQFK